jgi:hypothetical protein
MSVGMTVFTTLVGLTFVGLAIMCLVLAVIDTITIVGVTGRASVDLSLYILKLVAIPVLSYLAYRWFAIPVTPFTLTIGGRYR